MKYVVLLGDGMADWPMEALGGRTPLQVARKPNMDSIARIGRCGLARTVPEGMTPGSDVANLSIMGYDPRRYYTGRAPLEAAAMRIPLGEKEVAFRCNFVTVMDGIMDDYSAGHITSEEGAEIAESLKKVIPGGRIYPGVSYRNIVVLKVCRDAVCTPPHDIMGKPISDHLPRGDDAHILIDIMERARPLLEEHPVNRRRVSMGLKPANMIWLWGQGPAPSMPRFHEIYGLKGAVISAVDLLKGLGVCAGWRVIDVPGATGTIDTNYAGKVRAALEALGSVDLVYLHIEAPDEAAHSGDVEQKIRAIELFDERVVGPMIHGLERSGEAWRVLLLPDHPTPIEIRTHSTDPVPFAIAGSGVCVDSVDAFDEISASEGGYGMIEGNDLIRLLIAG
ncbi:MAG: cofactor-independent phosphoglycerate mutase [Methanothrix sp.]|uniref:2,3-bisphosphoglycerate-independent phosphoglycerate mutase n=1 Tax=Methanothrix thermoacetophila (strain DSM 6194 / JCM 14653 / NBRC 101360 / PT) TaxID=349307 RepID=APGM_METTP|nr:MULTISPECIES: cofactor-independent phosphoglycerate mutase [Methanothrix]A0B6L2.1 RecName: Full=2,3-bisphosphoglycerate-independent phosphoglycerate mutase; Short=BPG-independent PGAM; Short=Phosphoglyceromutase; Short=aPGAM [Methanothrix thermoacetophila PT]ABK14336.1 phosphoglycerate mutase [Methanothrix thermoacetophila PT]MBC7080328.1 cofactor-independent phosphoglycerate mutase [Methanothrix sp.]NPU87639.1 cofactor-independent phosphoglycerate mutase [Methanothrix sp.]